MENIECVGVREYAEEMPVEIGRAENGRLVIKAYNEAGHNSTQVDLLDLMEFLKEHKDLLRVTNE